MPADAANEQLNGLVTLLQAVGVDPLDLGGGGGGGADRGKETKASKGGGGARGAASKLDDAQLEAIIRKLQLAQQQAPQIIAALEEAQAEARSQKSGKMNNGSSAQQDEDQGDYDEEDDEFDEEANYPMVGKGVSDDISVVSDLTTPTVLTGVHVPDEEHYKETLPPMHGAGGPLQLGLAKKKNLVSPVRTSSKGVVAPHLSSQRRKASAGHGSRSGVSSRRKSHSDTMMKLEEEEDEESGSRPKGNQSRPSEKSKTPPLKSPTASRQARKKASPKPDPKSSFAAEWHASAIDYGYGWDAFETGSKMSAIDNDGFLVGETFDPFNGTEDFTTATGSLEDFSGSNPFTSSSSAEGETKSRGPRKSTKPKKPGSKPKGETPNHRASSSNIHSNSRPRRVRRASLGN